MSNRRCFVALLTFASVFVLVNSRWLNIDKETLAFKCPDGQHVTRIRSEYDANIKDRRWDFECGGGIVGTECTWTTDDVTNPSGTEVRTPTIRNTEWRANWIRGCPFDHVLSGIENENGYSVDDRRWRQRCCKISTRQPIEDTFEWIELNDLRGEIDYTVPDKYGIFTMVSDYDQYYRDRKYSLVIAKYPSCTSDEIGIQGNDVSATKTSQKLVGIVTGQGCSAGKKYKINLRSTFDMSTSNSLAITEGDTYSFSTTSANEAKVSLVVLNTGVSATVGLTQMYGGSKSWASTNARSVGTSESIWAISDLEFEGPAASILIGHVHQYAFDGVVNATVNVQCDDGFTTTDTVAMTLKRTTYARTNYLSKTAVFNSVDHCNDVTNECLSNLNAEVASDYEELFRNFEKCFEGIATIQ